MPGHFAQAAGTEVHDGGTIWLACDVLRGMKLEGRDFVGDFRYEAKQYILGLLLKDAE